MQAGSDGENAHEPWLEALALAMADLGTHAALFATQLAATLTGLLSSHL